MSETWTVRKVLAWTTQHFERGGVDAPRLTAEILLAHVLETDRIHLYVDLDRPLISDELSGYRSLIQRRANGEPTQYLTGLRHFYNRAFRVDSRVMVPRSETELLVEKVLQLLPPDRAARALDLCTGSGCIAVTLAAERPYCSVWATDISTAACEVARLNAELLEVGSRVSVLQGDLFGPLPQDARFDVVIANPPYVRSNELPGLSSEVQREPPVALDGGPDGLDVIRRVVAECHTWLRPGGTLALEIGETQGGELLRLLERQGLAAPRIEKDLAKLDRFAFASLPT
jgi:release factor glutamine methyltransferase